jgi:hypothetical protein
MDAKIMNAFGDSRLRLNIEKRKLLKKIDEKVTAEKISRLK